MDDMFDEEYKKAIQIGQENLAVLRLARAWCDNIDYTRGPFGIGLIEAASGLPISGGNLRCDFAEPPTSFAARLAAGAVDFYERNCIGCTDRKATDASVHLGTWSEAHIAERAELETQAARQRCDVETACRERATARRFQHGQCDPVSQSILDLLDRVDALERDQEAEQLLVKHAEMAPGDFSDALVEHLAIEGLAIGSDAFLRTVIAIFERQGRPAADTMLDIAFQAAEMNVAGESAGRVIATHAEAPAVAVSSLTGLVRLAAGTPDHFSSRRIGAEPAALLRLFDCDSGSTVKLLSDMLRDEDVTTRAQAAHAAEKVVAARPSAGALLLPALLDSLSHPDNSKYMGDQFAAAQVARVVADIFITDPEAADLGLYPRIRTAEPSLAKKLWACYQHACPSRFRQEVPLHVTNVILRRSLKLLEMDLEYELQRDVASTVSTAYHGRIEGGALALRDILRVVYHWSSRRHAMETNEPAREDLTAESFLTLESERTLVSAILSELCSALECAARQYPHEYVSLIDSEWDVSGTNAARVLLLDVLRVVIRDQESFEITVPLLRRALARSSASERAAAFRVIGEIRSSEVSAPHDLVNRVLQGFDDYTLIVLLGALRAAQRLEIPQVAKPSVINRAFAFAASYGPERVYERDVERALRLALRLAKDETYEVAVGRFVLELVASLPSGEAVELLRTLDLENHEEWTGAAVNALKVDPHPSYRGIGDSDRRVLLRKLAVRPTGQIAPHFGALVEMATERLPRQPWWAAAVADLLERHLEHERAAALSDKVVETLPDTREQRRARSVARQIALGRHANAAAVRGDREGAERALTEWTQILQDDDETVSRLGIQ